MVDAEIGSTANKYTIVAKLAAGGMAEIFLARNESTAGVERYVVLKRVLRDRANDIKFVNMFLDEARLSARLQHPNIAQVYDTGTLGDSYFFTMEYVHGETVRNILHEAHASKQRVPVATALTIIAGAAAGLQHAHERVGFDGRPLGIVHRDVSPSNLMVSYEGNVKLVDFGVAKATHRAQETQTGAVKGKVGYMSPEQIRNTAVDARSDLFSLGIVMWELLVGDRLFKRTGDFETMEAIISEPAPPPSTRRPELSPELDAIVCKLLQKSPALRYQTAYELLEALENATVRAGVSLSVSAVRRFMRELFGERAEPWVELARHDGHTDVVTITGEQYNDPSENETLSAQLDHLLDLSALWPAAPDDEEDGDDRAAVRAAAISTTSPTVADAVRAPTVPPPAPARISAPVTVPPVPRRERAPAPATEIMARRWLPPRPLLFGGAVAVLAVIGFVLASGDGTAEPIDDSRPSQPTPAAAPAAISAPAPAPAAITAPSAAPPPVEPAPAPDPVADAEQHAPTVATPVRSPASRDRTRAHTAAPPPRSTASKRPRGESPSRPDPVEVAPTPEVKRVERAKPESSAKTKCDVDPMACRR